MDGSSQQYRPDRPAPADGAGELEAGHGRGLEPAGDSGGSRDAHLAALERQVATLRAELAATRAALAAMEQSLFDDDVGERNEYRRKLEQEARRRDEFMATLGHELRNPLAALSNAAALLRRVSGDSQLERIARVVERQTWQMRRMVDDLLDVARIAEGKVQLEVADVDLGELVRSVAEDHTEMLAEKGLQLRSELPKSPGPLVRGDRMRLTQVVQNLLDNAAKFTDAPGSVVLRISEPDESSPFVVLAVCDSGCGMDADMLIRAFEPFRQSDRTIGRSRGGLGLGLPLVRGLVQLHGGHVEALSSGAGQGTEVRVTLPRLSGVRALREARQ